MLVVNGYIVIWLTYSSCGGKKLWLSFKSGLLPDGFLLLLSSYQVIFNFDWTSSTDVVEHLTFLNVAYTVIFWYV